MIYNFSISTPANTTEAAPIRTTMKLTRGIIHKIEVVFPYGAQGLHHARIRRAIHQIWPSNTDGDFATEGETIAYREHYDLASAPYTLTAETWNTDTANAHRVIIRLGLLRKEILTPWLRSWQETTHNNPDS